MAYKGMWRTEQFQGQGTKHYKNPLKGKKRNLTKKESPMSDETTDTLNTESGIVDAVLVETSGDPHALPAPSVDHLTAESASLTIPDDTPIDVRDPLMDEDALEIEVRRPQGKRTLTRSEEVFILKLRKEGLTQQAIANRMNCSQKTVSNILREYGQDATELVAGYVKTQGLDVVKDVLKTGDGRDKLEVLDRAGVLEKKEKGVGGGITIVQTGDNAKAAIQINRKWQE